MQESVSSEEHLRTVAIKQKTEKAHFKSTQVSLNIKQVPSDAAEPLFPVPR